MTQTQTTSENIAGVGENSGNQHFRLDTTECVISKVPSENALNYTGSKFHPLAKI